MGRTIVSVNLDVTDADEVRNAVQLILQKFGRIDILVNNAGIARDQLALRMKPVEWGIVIDTNLTAAFTCCQAVLRSMLKQRSGRIINVSSVVGQSGNPGQANYAASKAGLVGLTKSLALEVASRGITVNAVAPGMVDTDMTSELAESSRDALLARIPMRRIGRPDEIASTVCFLASDEASYITGQVIGVNGGMYM
jgi:3-oxoacyl-[acyl-carrier protein] reductase